LLEYRTALILMDFAAFQGFPTVNFILQTEEKALPGA